MEPANLAEAPLSVLYRAEVMDALNADDGTAGDKAQDTALNGAQVQAAQGIVESVASGLLPRATGVTMLVEFFNIPAVDAEALMGDVGAGFVPTPDPEAAPKPEPNEGEE